MSRTQRVQGGVQARWPGGWRSWSWEVGRGREETQLVRKENTSREEKHMVDQIGVSEPVLELR